MIVETARGVEYGTVIGGIREVTDDRVVQPLKAVIRVATQEDDLRAEKSRAKGRMRCASAMRRSASTSWI